MEMSVWKEVIGYTGSFLIATGLMMGNMKKLRIFNLFGATSFATYGLLVSAYPVFLLNTFNVIVNLYHLYKLSKSKDYFVINETLQSESFFVTKFLDYFKNDIKKFFPEFDKENIKGSKVYLVSRNMNPVGLFIYEEKEGGEIFIHLDYCIEKYRDLKNGRFVFSEKSKDLRDRGFHTFTSYSTEPKHINFLLKMGFIPDIEIENLYRRPI